MYRPHSFALLVLLGSLIWTIPAVASEPVIRESGLSVQEQFSLFHDTLSSAASNLLINTKYLPPQPLGRESDFERGGNELGDEERQVRLFAQQYWGGRSDDLQQALGRLRQLRPTLEPILRAEGVPSGLIAVVLIESAVQPTAESPREARGLWQFIPATARRYGLSANPELDERLHTAKATRAAARYLRDLHLRFGDWLLALAAYNAGEHTVQWAIDRAGRTDFWSLSSKKLLPAETRDYVPAVLAALELLVDSNTLSPPVETGGRGVESQILYAQVSADN
jgi:hypothetical protein